jgi:ADP-heptose:LPS heptosyltransferase
MSPDVLGRVQRVLFIRLRSMGDCVLTTPAIALVKHAFPNIRTGVVVEDRFAPVFTGNPDIDDVLPPRLRNVVGFGADLCINLHGGTRSIALTAASAAQYRAGFAHFRGGKVYNIRIPTAQEILGLNRKVHTAEHLASAVIYLGVAGTWIPRARLSAPPPEPAAKPYAVIHPFASEPEKTWRTEGFLEVARKLEGLDVRVIGASTDDLSPFREFPTIAGAPLKQMMSLLSGASLFIGNDSGPAHIAAAYGVPEVVIFGNSDSAIWKPWRTKSRIVVAAGPIANVGVDQVLASVHRLRSAE